MPRNGRPGRIPANPDATRAATPAKGNPPPENGRSFQADLPETPETLQLDRQVAGRLVSAPRHLRQAPFDDRSQLNGNVRIDPGDWLGLALDDGGQHLRGRSPFELNFPGGHLV